MDRTSIGTMRYLFFGVGLVGGVILLAAGQTLIGGLLVAMAAVRIVLLVSMQREAVVVVPGARRERPSRRWTSDVAASCRYGARRRRDRDRRCARRVAERGQRRPLDLRGLAADAGVPSDRVVDAVVRDANTKVDRAVADGRMASDRASLLRTRLPNWAEQLVVQTPTMLAGTGSGPA